MCEVVQACVGACHTMSCVFFDLPKLYFFVTGFLSEPGAQCFSQADQLVSPRDPSVSTFPALWALGIELESSCLSNKYFID